MKKRLYLIAAAALALVACAKEEAYQPTESTIPGAKRIVLGASFELPGDPTKSDYDAAGNFTWSDDDAILIGSDGTSGDKNWGGGSIIAGQSEIGPGYATAQFDCTLIGGDVTAIAAVFPNTVKPSYSAGTLSLTLPATIAWTDTQLANPANATMQVDNIMVARYVDIYSEGYAHGKTEGIQFHNVGGLFCLTLKNVPAGADKLVFTADKKINGTFAVSNVVDSTDHNNYPVIATAATETKSEKSVTITFPTITNGENKMTFFIPVPVGSYVIGFDVQNAEAKSLWAFSASRENGVERGHIVKMPTLSHVIVGGSGDGATNIITTPSGFSGTVNLPSTNNSIYVRMNQTGGAITLAYSDAPALHPANVYLQALGNVETLDINLPDSHVELTGVDDVTNVITNVSSYTSYSTLKVDKKVKIGKDEDVNSGITITGGSLDLAAPVDGKVIVNIPPDNNNETEEKVAINITSAIKDLVVTRAADNVTPADKVYVSLSSGASVAKTISVPEVNCNLYVAPGVAVSVIDTKAAENTVEGQVDTLSATGASTIVTVTEKADVTKSISATQGATVIVDNNALKDENNNAYNTTQTKDVSSTISTVDGLVATIGSAGYSSLDSAVEAAADGATITIIKEGNYTIPAIDNTLTIVGGVEGVNVNHTGASAVTTITSGKTLTLKSIALNLDKSFYQGFGTSGTGANAGALVMENCSIDGSLSLFGVSTFKNCTFTANDANAGAYNIWAVYSNATFTGCSFTNTNRAVNVYDPACGSTRKTVTFTNCSFTASEKKKAAINIHHNPAPVQASGAKFDVVITDCTTSGTWASSVAETGEPADATICNSALWMVSDIKNWTNGDITVNGVNVYDAPVAQIGTTTYTTLEAAVAAAQSDDTITLIGDVVLTETLVNSKKVVLDLGEYSISGAVGAGTEAQSEAGKLIINRGHLTINSANNKGRIWNTNIDAQGRDAVYNAENATIIINGGVFGDKDIDTANENADINRGMALRNYGTAVLNGGKFTAADNFTTGGGYAYSIVNYGGTMTIKDGVEVYGRNNGNLSVNGGEVIVEGGLFTANAEKIHYNIYLTAGGTMTVNGGTFTKGPLKGSNALSIYKSGGDLNITGGTFNKLTDGALANTADGISITGGTFTVDPSAYVAEGYKAVNNGNGTWTVQEFKGVAKVGTSYYATLEEAFAAVPAGTPTTITMIANAMINVAGSALTVPTNKDITLDLNGFQVVGTAETGNTSALITNNGTLTIKDSSDSNADGTGTGKLISGATPTWKWDGSDNFSGSYASNTITNCGTLTIESGYLQNTSNGSATYAVDNNSGSRTATLNVNGGYLTAVRTVVRQFCNSITNQNTVNITAGSIATSGYAGIWTQLPGSNGQEKLATLNVTGGTVSAASYAWYDYSFGDSFAAVNYAISGGTFTGELYSYAVKRGVKPGFVTGGTFSTDPSDYVSAGYEAVQSGNNWNVVEKTTPAYWIDNAADDYESVDNDNKVITIATAAQLAKLAKDIQDNDANPSTFEYKGWTFKLTSNIDLSGKIWTPIGADLTNYYHASFRGTFDGNGHKITNMHAVANRWAGLFGPIHSGMEVIIKDLTIEDFVVESNHYAGAIVGWLEQATQAVTISGCVVNQGTITSTPELIGTSYDNGDKVGGICGYIYKATSAASEVSIVGNTVSNVDITAYRDFGGLLGYAANVTTINNNTITNVNLYEDFTHNYKDYTDYTSCDYGAVVGENSNSSCGENTVTNVKIYTNATGIYTQVQQ